MSVSEKHGAESALTREEQWHMHRLLARCRKGLEAVMDRELRPFGISAVELAILDALSEGKASGRAATPTELAAKVVRRHNSEVACLLNMERAGLVSLHKKSEGRRTMEVEITPQGEEVYAIAVGTTSRVTEILGALTVNQRQQLTALLEKLDQAIVDCLHGVR